MPVLYIKNSSKLLKYSGSPNVYTPAHSLIPYALIKYIFKLKKYSRIIGLSGAAPNNKYLA